MKYLTTESLYLITPIGGLALEIREPGLQRVSFSEAPSHAESRPKSKLGNLAYKQLMSYFDKAHDQFTIPLILPDHTPFRHRVWSRLAKIKLGRTITYKQLAQKLNTHPRAIGGACAANPIPIVIPCHRVLSQSGALCGYTGPNGSQDLDIKAWLLNHEGISYNE